MRMVANHCIHRQTDERSNDDAEVSRTHSCRVSGTLREGVQCNVRWASRMMEPVAYWVR